MKKKNATIFQENKLTYFSPPLIRDAIKKILKKGNELQKKKGIRPEKRQHIYSIFCEGLNFAFCEGLNFGLFW
jgi:hypothetical protein